MRPKRKYICPLKAQYNMNATNKLAVQYVKIDDLKPAKFNPRKWDDTAKSQLKASIKKFGMVDPIICNNAPKRKNIVIGGHFRLEVAKELKIETVPVVYINIPDIQKEKELNLRLNKNTGEFDWELLAEFNEGFLSSVGFSSEELDDVFGIEDTPEQFDINKELRKLDIHNVSIKKGDVYEINGSRLMCGDSCIEDNVLKLMGDERADMCFTDPPYDLDYLHGKSKNGKPTED